MGINELKRNVMSLIANLKNKVLRVLPPYMICSYADNDVFCNDCECNTCKLNLYKLDVK